MLTTPEQLAAANKANVEAMLTLANTAFASAERFAALNLNTARAVLEDSVNNAKTLLGAKDLQEVISLQATLAQPSVEKAVAYSRSVYEISAQTQEEFSKLVEAQFAEVNKNVASSLDKAAKSAPAGSDVAVAAVKSAIAAANSAYDTMSKAAKQVAEIAEANVAAATNATVKAVGAAARPRSRRPPKQFATSSSRPAQSGRIRSPGFGRGFFYPGLHSSRAASLRRESPPSPAVPIPAPRVRPARYAGARPRRRTTAG
jgi:phasin family protein